MKHKRKRMVGQSSFNKLVQSIINHYNVDRRTAIRSINQTKGSPFQAEAIGMYLNIDSNRKQFNLTKTRKLAQ